MYEVTVRLIRVTETWRSVAIVGRAGKYMLLAKPEKVAAEETRLTSSHFWVGVKALYGAGGALSVATANERSSLVCSVDALAVVVDGGWLMLLFIESSCPLVNNQDVFRVDVSS